MTDLPILTAPLDPVVAETISDPRSALMPGAPVGAGFQTIDKRAQAREEAARKAQVAHNVTNLVAANWWHAQAAEQRGDHVAAAQHGIARGRLLAAAKAEGLRLG